MRILLLAPHPFHQERGSPIAVDNLLRELSKRGDVVDVLTYHEGEDRSYPNVRILRIPNPPLVHDIRAGFSWKKVAADVFMFISAFRLALRGKYQLVHAVEEAVFIAWCMKLILGIPYVYDMDSSLAEQMIVSFPWMGRIRFLLKSFEWLAVRGANVVMPVCAALAEDVAKYGNDKIVILWDVSLLEEVDGQFHEDIRALVQPGRSIVMYVGNLEVYQGIDLLLESFALASWKSDSAELVIIGGQPDDIEKYKEEAVRLKIDERTHFLGPRPVDDLAYYLSQADVLVSPRIVGTNTPMKIYSYLDSGKPVLATNIPTHTQVLHDGVAMMAEPEAETFFTALNTLVKNNHLRSELGQAGKKFVRREFPQSTYSDTVRTMFDYLEQQLDQGKESGDDRVPALPLYKAVRKP